MVEDDVDYDDYVANLLKQDAKNTTKQYKLVGLDAFLPQKSRSSAPKPNTRFLKHIIRETDSHNAALLAKEAEESQARLRRMNREKERRSAGRLTPPDLTEEDRYPGKRKRSQNDEERGERESRRKKERDHTHNKDISLRRDRYKERHRRRDDNIYAESEDEDSRRRSQHSQSKRHRERRHRYSSDGEPSHTHRHRRRSYSRSTSRSMSPRRHSRKDHKSSNHRHRSRSGHRSHDREACKRSPVRTGRKRRSAVPDSDSDPLEAIVGPLPPPPPPVIRSRGRGAHKVNSMAMDARFSSSYDPSTDVHVHSDVEDEWGDALEALRDRQRWKQQGAERLKAAGFSNEQIKKWEKGDEKTEEDVRWAMTGEGREWDRGKVFDKDGDVELKAEWGRLK